MKIIKRLFCSVYDQICRYCGRNLDDIESNNMGSVELPVCQDCYDHYAH